MKKDNSKNNSLEGFTILYNENSSMYARGNTVKRHIGELTQAIINQGFAVEINEFPENTSCEYAYDWLKENLPSLKNRLLLIDDFMAAPVINFNFGSYNGEQLPFLKEIQDYSLDDLLQEAIADSLDIVPKDIQNRFEMEKYLLLKGMGGYNLEFIRSDNDYLIENKVSSKLIDANSGLQKPKLYAEHKIMESIIKKMLEAQMPEKVYLCKDYLAADLHIYPNEAYDISESGTMLFNYLHDDWHETGCEYIKSMFTSAGIDESQITFIDYKELEYGKGVKNIVDNKENWVIQGRYFGPKNRWLDSPTALRIEHEITNAKTLCIGYEFYDDALANKLLIPPDITKSLEKLLDRDSFPIYTMRKSDWGGGEYSHHPEKLIQVRRQRPKHHVIR